jgi:hypothetical protein
MTGKLVAQEFVIPTAFAVVLIVALTIGAVSLIERCLGPIDQGEARNMIIGPADPRP